MRERFCGLGRREVPRFLREYGVGAAGTEEGDAAGQAIRSRDGAGQQLRRRFHQVRVAMTVSTERVKKCADGWALVPFTGTVAA